MVSSLARQFGRRKLLNYLKLLYIRIMGEKPLPLEFAIFLKNIAGEKIIPVEEFCVWQGKDLNNKFLKRILFNHKFTGWSLDHLTLNFIEKYIKKHEPKRILELGSGISTLCLARYMMETHRENRKYVISLEEDKDFVYKTKKLVSEYLGEKYAEVFYAPLRKYKVGDEEVEFYSFPKKVEELVLEFKPDTVIIDGPRGSARRKWSIYLIHEYISKPSVFFLDDAFRDIHILKTWNGKEIGENKVYVKGIIPFPKGLGIGIII